MSQAALTAAPSEVPTETPADVQGSASVTADGRPLERRAHRRHTAAELPFVQRVRLKYGPAAALIDLSSGGAQIETTNFRLQPGTTVVLEMSGEQIELSVPAQVLRCQLTTLLPEPQYRGALRFKKPLELEALVTNRAATEPLTEFDPSEEQAQLRVTLKRLVLGEDREEGEALARMCQAVEAAQRTLDTPAGRRGGAALATELAALFRAVDDALETGPTPSALVVAIEEHLSLVVPARAIRIAHPESVAQMPGSDAIFLSVPPLSPSAPATRLMVEFPEGCEPQELHLQMLRAGVQLVALARELARLNGADTPLTPKPA